MRHLYQVIIWCLWLWLASCTTKLFVYINFSLSKNPYVSHVTDHAVRFLIHILLHSYREARELKQVIEKSLLLPQGSKHSLLTNGYVTSNASLQHHLAIYIIVRR